MDYIVIAPALLLLVALLYANARPQPRREHAPQANPDPNALAPQLASMQWLTPVHAPASAPAPHRPTGRVVQCSRFLTEGRYSHLPTYKAGREGEDRVVRRMDAVLDPSWTIFRNVGLSDQEGDIDIVLVGPGGVWAVEVKAYTGEFVVKNGTWYTRTADGRMVRKQRGPGAQVRTNAMRLSRYLAQNGMPRHNYVERVVILSSDAPLDVQSTGTHTWTSSDLDDQLRQLNKWHKLNPHEVGLAVGILQHSKAQLVH